MTFSRREFLGASSTMAMLALSRSVRATGLADRSLKILILGGTGFLGPHMVESALARGHQVTLFNRGKTSPEMFPNLETIIGDRNDNLEGLKGRQWDIVFDNSASVPRWVRQSAQVLHGQVGSYWFTSSVSVYRDFRQVGQDESYPLIELDDPTVEEVRGDTYGGMKALCEQAVQEIFAERAIIVRPTLIIGPLDKTDRFTYWPVRLARGGTVLAPGTRDNPVQYIDARDLSAWAIRMAESGHHGVYNAAGPAQPEGMATMLEGIARGVGSEAELIWVDAAFLSQHKVRPWSDMPVWIPTEGDYTGFSSISNQAALDCGLTFRPVAASARDTLDWFRTLPTERQASLKSGLSAEREAEVLALWQQQRASG